MAVSFLELNGCKVKTLQDLVKPFAQLVAESEYTDPATRVFNICPQKLSLVLKHMFDGLQTLQVECCTRPSSSRLMSRLALLSALCSQDLLNRSLGPQAQLVLAELAIGLPVWTNMRDPQDTRHLAVFRTAAEAVGLATALQNSSASIVSHRGQMNSCLTLAKHLLDLCDGSCLLTLDIVQEEQRRTNLIALESGEYAKAAFDQLQELSARTQAAFEFQTARVDEQAQQITFLKRKAEQIQEVEAKRHHASTYMQMASESPGASTAASSPYPSPRYIM